ncbi:MAG: hypothetical protein GC172_11525 [Phycisphaera sp.]|jgi:hypothetical protein|nr:hypothetical protein [Phycisphaera sp.]
MFSKTLSIAAAIAASVLFLSASGCTTSRNVVVLDGRTSQAIVDADYIETSYRAVHYLLTNARGNIMGDDAFDASRPVIWASTVDLNNYGRTTNFGRLMGESLAIAMQNHRKNKMIQMTLRQGTVPITGDGEFLLTRDARDLATKFNAGAALVSSYSVAVDRVYVQCSLINVDQNTVVGAVQFDLPLGPRTEALLKGVLYPAEAAPLLQSRTTALTN